MKRVLFLVLLALMGCKKKNPYEDNPFYIDPSYIRYFGSEGEDHWIADVSVSTNGYIMVSTKVIAEGASNMWGVVSKWSSDGSLIWTKRGPDGVDFGGIDRINGDRFMVLSRRGYYLVDLDGNMRLLGYQVPFGIDFTTFNTIVFRGDTAVYIYDSTLKFICMEARGVNGWNRLWSLCTNVDSLSSYYRFAKTTVYHRDGYVGVAVLENNRLIVFKVGMDGNLRWSKEVNVGGIIWDGVEAFDGGIILVGDGGCPLVVKLDSLGNLQWHKKFCESPNGYNWVFGFNTVSPTSDGKYFAFGYSSTCFCITAAKFDDTGNVEILREYIWGPYQEAFGSEVMPDGDIILVSTCEMPNQKGTYNKTCLLKLDKNGNPHW